MIEHSRWKFVAIIVVILLGLLYAAPNLYPDDSAVQITALRSGIIDEALKERAQGVLEKNKIAFKRIDLEKDRVTVRLNNGDDQIKAADQLRPAFGNDYTVALNLAPTVPKWLSAVKAKSMTLGLDLRGGVHFLMEVDEKAGIEKKMSSFEADIPAALKKENVKYTGVSRSAAGVNVMFASDKDREAGQALIAKTFPQLESQNTSVVGESYPLIARIKENEVATIISQAVEQNVTTLRNRISALGEPVMQRQGRNRIVVQLPGVQDTAKAKEWLGGTATLEYRSVDQKNNAFEAAATGKSPPTSELFFDRDQQPYLLNKKVIVTGEMLTDAQQSFDQNGRAAVSVNLNKVGADRMFEFTSKNVGSLMAVLLIETMPDIKIVNGKEVPGSRETRTVINAATIQGVFSNQFQTTGLDSIEEAKSIASGLRAGSLAAPVQIVEERVVGPSQGKENIAKGLNSVLFGLLAVVVFIGIYYKVFGLIANFALVCNLVLLIAVLSIAGATLTMPGIAGIVLTLGMAIDSNVLICERIREEVRNGNTPMASLKAGYEKAWATILDANVTHLIAGIGLTAFGSGPIKGFAITLLIGILTSMFTSVTVTHVISGWLFGNRKLTSLPV